VTCPTPPVRWAPWQKTTKTVHRNSAFPELVPRDRQNTPPTAIPLVRAPRRGTPPASPPPVIAAVLVLWLARRLQPAWLLVTGVAIAALMQGVMTVVQLSGNPQLQGVLSWLAGSTWYARPHTAPLLVLLALVLLAAALFALWVLFGRKKTTS